MITLVTLVAPLILMAFMIGMERVERPMRGASEEQEVEDFLADADSTDVDAFVREGVSGARARRLQGGRLGGPASSHSSGSSGPVASPTEETAG